MEFSVAPASFVDDVIKMIDGLTAQFIEEGFRALVEHGFSSGLFVAILTLYVVYFLYQVNFYHTPLADATIHLIKVCLVFVISTNWNIFYLLIYNVATNEPLHVLHILLAKRGETLADGSLNDTFITGITQAIHLLSHLPLSLKGSLCALFGAILLILGTFCFTLVALSLIIISKFYLAISLALAPYFLILYLFNGTKGLSESWVKSCLNYALVPIFLGCVLLFTTLLAKACLHAGAPLTADSKAPSFIGIVMYLACAIISLFLLKSIPEKAASVTSSLAIAGAGRMVNYAKQSVGSRLNQTGAGIKKGFSQTKDNFSQRQQKLKDGINQRAQERRAQIEERRARNARSGY